MKIRVVALAVMVVPSLALAALPGQYKRVHQNLIDTVTAGDADKAVAKLEDLSQKHPDDPEHRYMLAVAYAQQGKADEAVACMEKAVELGLPPGRFIAGPGDLLAPIHDRPEYKKLVEALLHVPVHGPAVGAVTDASARFWVRTAKAASVQIIVRKSEGETDPLTATAASTADSDFTAVVEVTGLQGDTPYEYEVKIDGKSQPADKQQRFRTSPPPGSKVKFTLAFGGGAGYVPPNERVWTTIAKQNPRLLLMLGDNVYIDQPTSEHRQRYTYYRRQSRPEYRALLAHTPVYSIWDDHDFGKNDCVPGPEIDEPTWKRPVWRIFTQNWVNPGYGGGEKQPGCWSAFSLGDVDFILLDGRYYRSSPKGDNPSMLGPVQKAWLKETLAAGKGTFTVICSPVPWDFRTKGKSRDTWNGFRDEREEIFSFIEKNDIGGVVLMSADRHRSDAWRIERQSGYDFYEFNSSRLTNQHVHGTMKEALFSYNAKQSFGLVSFDTTAADPTVTYRVMTIDGDVVHTLTVKRSQLTPR